MLSGFDSGCYTGRMTAIESDNTANGARRFVAAAHMSYSRTVLAQFKGGACELIAKRHDHGDP